MEIELLQKLVKELETERKEIEQAKRDKTQPVKDQIKEVAKRIYRVVDILKPISDTGCMDFWTDNGNYIHIGSSMLGSSIRINNHFIVSSNSSYGYYFYSYSTTYEKLLKDLDDIKNIEKEQEKYVRQLLVNYNNKIEKDKREL